MEIYCDECNNIIYTQYVDRGHKINCYILDGKFYHDKCYIKHINRRNGSTECPQCKGMGYTLEPYNAYPSGLPDSGFAEDIKYREKTCSMCSGKGFANKKLVEVISYKFEE